MGPAGPLRVSSSSQCEIKNKGNSAATPSQRAGNQGAARDTRAMYLADKPASTATPKKAVAKKAPPRRSCRQKRRGRVTPI